MKIKDMYYYVQGNIRYYLFYSTFAELIREHIREQIIARVASMDKKCFNNGQCKLCGCSTTALQMCDKACNKPCYPSMMNKKEWETITVTLEEGYPDVTFLRDDVFWVARKEEDTYKFILLKVEK